MVVCSEAGQQALGEGRHIGLKVTVGSVRWLWESLWK